MNNYVWIIPVNKASSFGEAGVSASYIIPKGDMKTAPETLANNRLWVALRGRDDRVFLSLKIKRIEKIIEGYHKEDYLISIDLLSSFRLTSNHTEAHNYITEHTASLNTGISKINKSSAKDFSQKIKQNIEVRFIKADKNKLAGINEEIIPHSGKLLAKSALRLIISHVNLNDIWAQGRGKKLSAFSNFASAIIQNHSSSKIASEATNLLMGFDPIPNLFINDTEHAEKIISTLHAIPKVDTDFTKLEPKKIYAREFLSDGNKATDLEAALKKTEKAEKVHQEMLRDIADFLISKGIAPFESSSVDLLFKSNDCLKVCEIKSANLENLLAQASKGAFQLTCYIHELSKGYNDISPLLIVQKINNEEMELYVKEILSKMNIPVLYYDSAKSWPNKVVGIL